MGFGIDSEYSRSLIPRPPQKITTFMPSPSLWAGRHQSRSLRLLCQRAGARSRQKVLEPGLAAEAAVLLSAQPVRQTSCGELDVLVGQHLVLGDRAPELAAEHQPLRQ